MQRYRWIAGLGIGLAVLGAACDGDDDGPSLDPICDAAELSAALLASESGDEVRVGNCRVQGHFVVPAGVTLSGTGPNSALAHTSTNESVVRLTPGSSATRLLDLTIESSTPAGVLARGSGSVTVERVVVHAAEGIGMGADGVSTLTLTDVQFTGPVTAVVAATLPPDVGPEDTATHGLVVVRAGNAALTGVTASGFAQFGGLLVESTSLWSGGGASDNLGTGLMVHGGSATLEDLEVCRTMQGMRLIPAYGMVFAAGADVDTVNLNVCEGEGYGLLHDDATVHHADLIGRDNNDAAVWVQRCDGFEMTGAATTLVGNKFAGVVLLETSNATVSDAHIDDSELATRIFGETGSVDVGDGVQVVEPAGVVTLQNLSMSGNARVGMLFDLGGGSMDSITLGTVTVSGTGTALGAIAQNGTVAEGWDSSITREGAVLTNDAEFAGSLSIVGSVAGGDIPGAAAIESDGINGIIGDCG